MKKPTKIGLVALAALAVGSSGIAHAANPAERVATKLLTLHRAINTYPADARSVASCVGTPGAREWRCRVTTKSPSMLNGGDAWRYTCTGRFIRRGTGTVLVGFKAYAVGGIA